MGPDCKEREKRKKNWGEINIKPIEWGETLRGRRKGKTGARQIFRKNGTRLQEREGEKNWDEINIKPKEWGETVRVRRKKKKNWAR